MAQKQLRGAPLATVAPRVVYSSPALDTRNDSCTSFAVQASLAVSRLSRRFGLPPATALAVAEANRWGR